MSPQHLDPLTSISVTISLTVHVCVLDAVLLASLLQGDSALHPLAPQPGEASIELTASLSQAEAAAVRQERTTEEIRFLTQPDPPTIEPERGEFQRERSADPPVGRPTEPAARLPLGQELPVYGELAAASPDVPPPDSSHAANLPRASDPPAADQVSPSPAQGSRPSAASAATKGAQYDVLPRRISNTPPSYPAEALAEGITGRVILRVKVSAAGNVTAATIHTSSGHRVLDQAALAAVKQWRFAPATRLGLSVPAEIAVPVTFKIAPRRR